MDWPARLQSAGNVRMKYSPERPTNCLPQWPFWLWAGTIAWAGSDRDLVQKMINKTHCHTVGEQHHEQENGRRYS